MNDTSRPDYPTITVSSRVTTHRRRDMPVFSVTIGKITFYMWQGILVRVICGDLDLSLNSAGVANLFPPEQLGKRVNLSELKFHLMRLLGEQSMEIIEPFIDKALGVNEA